MTSQSRSQSVSEPMSGSGPTDVRVRATDLLLAAVLVALAGALALENVLADDPTIRVDSHSWWQLPVALATAGPVLWWRRGLVPVLVASLVAMAVHLVAFGDLVRCGSGLPLTFVLAFLVGLTSLRRPWWPALGLVAVLNALVLGWDTAAGVGLLPVTLVLSLALFGIGRAVAHRAEMGHQLQEHNEQLRVLRDERASLDVTDDRARLSARLEVLLDERLGQLAAVAESGSAADVSATRTLLATLEEDSRRTLGDMREIVGLLRGGEVSLAPAPSVAHLDALLARHLGPTSRLRVSGDPRVLPESVELSAYRIVEHLVGALEGEASAEVAVGMRFDDDALEIRVEGPVTRTADLRGAVNRARERARLHAGSLEVRTGRGQAQVVARLPVLAGS